MAHLIPSPQTNNNTIQCESIPSLVNSGGIFGEIRPLAASLPVLEVHIFAIFFVSHSLHFFLNRWGIPILASQVIAGIVLGRTGLAKQTSYGKVIVVDSEEILGTIAGFGFQLFVFLAGVKTDLSIIGKTGKKALFFGVLSTVIPLLFGVPTMLLVNNYWGLDKKSQLALFFVTTVHSVSAFSVVYGVISDLKILNSELGRLVLSSASVSDMLSMFLALCSLLTGLAYVGVSVALVSIVSTIAFSIMIVTVVRPALAWVIRQTPEGRPVKDLYIDIIVIGALGSALLSNYFGISVVLGSVAFGLAVPTGPPLASQLVNRLEAVVSGVLIPLTVALCTIRVDLLAINFDDKLTKCTAIILTVVMLAKFAGCLIPPLYCKLPKNDSTAFALIMSNKGIIELFAFAYVRERKVVPDGMFSFLILSILFTALVYPAITNWLYDPSRKYAGYQKRNIMYSKELHILACISRPDSINSTINFLEASCPLAERPAVIDVLHLIKLRGRASPIFISHEKQKKIVSEFSYSENVIRSFNHFQQNNSDNVSTNVFTAISPPELMHEDICTLAFDRLSSFIVLPFHKKWLLDGYIESEDITLRNLNYSMLEEAPCSVGILIDRGNLGSISWESSNGPSLNVAMIFLGGCDDREALVLANLMAQHRSVCVTIIRLVLPDDACEVDWEKMLDSEVLRDYKANNISSRDVQYAEVKVKGGLETARIIHSMIKEFNFFIVGRRRGIETPQTLGLEESMEYPELGVTGSLLTGLDAAERYSVLVVQQQITL